MTTEEEREHLINNFKDVSEVFLALLEERLTPDVFALPDKEKQDELVRIVSQAARQAFNEAFDYHLLFTPLASGITTH